jgi:hypothetical protein
MLFAMPQLTAFLLSTAYVLSGPALMLRGERLGAKVSVLRPVAPASSSNDKSQAATGTARASEPARGTGGLSEHPPRVQH